MTRVVSLCAHIGSRKYAYRHLFLDASCSGLPDTLCGGGELLRRLLTHPVGLGCCNRGWRRRRYQCSDSCILEEGSHLNSAPKGDGSEDVLVQISFTSRFTVSEYPRPIVSPHRRQEIPLNYQKICLFNSAAFRESLWLYFGQRDLR